MKCSDLRSRVPFDAILHASAERASFQGDWDRQRASARAIIDQFDQGFDTVLLADEVGMGKTYVALSVMVEHIMQSPANDRKVLLITPPSSVLRDKWEQEVLSFDAKYVCTEGRKKHLRPLQVNDYWDLLRNLHDYANQGSVQRVHEADRTAFLFCLFQWASKRLKKGSRMQRWPDLRDFDENDIAFFHFCSRYSEQAIFAFLDEVNASRAHELADLVQSCRTANCAPYRIANLFKEFAPQQDRFEANIFIMGMNTVRRPRSDKRENKRLCMFLLGQLLAGRHGTTRETIVKALESVGVIPEKRVHRWGTYLEQVAELARVDFYGLKAAAARVFALPPFATRWDGLFRNLLNQNTVGVQDFFRDACEAVFREKLFEANVDLAVIDEVHNWKNGNLGAEDFRCHYAPSIATKLIMSATPFQIAEGEMQRLFDFVQRRDGQTAAIVTQIFQAGGDVETALKTSAAFGAAWQTLSGCVEDRTAMHRLLSEERLETLPAKIDAAKGDPGLSDGLRTFLCALHDYRRAISRLEHALRKIMVRHTKPRERRHFHIGADFGKAAPAAQRRSLYLVDGYASEQDALINFVGIRLDQLIRRESKQSYEANARLLGGITSSTSAYRESRQKLDNDQSKSAATKAYGALLERLLTSHPHPKVMATVDRAFENFIEGRKTLIFCERVATLDDIRASLLARINAYLTRQSSQDALKRESLLKNTAFVDNSWWLSLRSACERDDDWGKIDRHHFGAARDFAKRQIAAAGIKATPRRVIRLIDSYMLHIACEQRLLESLGWNAAETMFSALYRDIDMPDDDNRNAPLHAYLNSEGNQDLERIEEHADEDADEDIDAVIEQVFTRRRNLWQGEAAAPLHTLLWQLLESEAKQLLALNDQAAHKGTAFAVILTDLFEGLRKIVLRHDLIARYDQYSHQVERIERIRDGFFNMPVGHETMLIRTMRFLRSLLEENGSINQAARQNSKRKSLWQGVFLQKVECVETMSGAVDQVKRRSLCAAFNSPLLPDVLICTAIGSEGIDLHRHCAEIIHHDLPWNPARLEQRIGRLDRVNSLAENTPELRIQIGIPFLAHNYEKFQYDVVYSRAQKFEVLMGRPDYAAADVDEETFSECDDASVREIEDTAASADGEVLATLPDCVVDYLRMDLSVWKDVRGNT